MSTTQERVIKVLTDHLGTLHPIKLTDAIVDDLDADSLDTIEIVMFIEEEFDIQVDEQELIDKCNSFNVQNIIDLVDELVK